ncbi:hypothetical protein EVAR_90494_1 [Eumeta japonica]|uniref:Uncharacterized protein n=1 Tax=Eumeta variegata TaxID=151549 RepID=A0A4C2AC03_EUMVA|nr:hypothetical protein EVAR_90494_1 [Eumeta japonica]
MKHPASPAAWHRAGGARPASFPLFCPAQGAGLWAALGTYLPSLEHSQVPEDRSLAYVRREPINAGLSRMKRLKGVFNLSPGKGGSTRADPPKGGRSPSVCLLTSA